MARLFRNTPGCEGGKFLVVRRDGTVPDWPYFVLGARDPAAWETLLAYADTAEHYGLDPEYVADIRKLSVEFENYLKANGRGDPDAPKHRTDDPDVVSRMTPPG